MNDAKVSAEVVQNIRNVDTPLGGRGTFPVRTPLELLTELPRGTMTRHRQTAVHESEDWREEQAGTAEIAAQRI